MYVIFCLQILDAVGLEEMFNDVLKTTKNVIQSYAQNHGSKTGFIKDVGQHDTIQNLLKNVIIEETISVEEIIIS